MISALALAAALLLPVAAAPSDDPNALLKQITSGDRVATDRAVARLAHLGAGASIGRALGVIDILIVFLAQMLITVISH